MRSTPYQRIQMLSGGLLQLAHCFCTPSGPGMMIAPTCCWYYLIPVDFLNLAHIFVYNLLNIPQIIHFECVFIAKTLINTIFYLYTFGISPSKAVCVCVCTLSPFQLFVIPCTVAHQAPLSTQFFQMRIQEWVAIASLGIFPSRDQTCISFASCSGRRILYHYATWENPSSYCCSTKMSNPQRFFP